MGIAALILGIISIVIALIPVCGSIAFVPALVGLILGIVDTVKKGKAGEKKRNFYCRTCFICISNSIYFPMDFCNWCRRIIVKSIVKYKF